VKPAAVLNYGRGVRSAPKIQIFHEAGQRLELRDLGSHIELMFGKVPILTTASLDTEHEFGKLAATIEGSHPPRVLIGGLGFGVTLGAVLESVGPNAEVIIVEKLQTVIRLVRGELGHLTPGVLDDPRVRLVNEDVGRVITNERNLDMILLDVDNGPDWASFKSNAHLYGPLGLQKARDALRPGGQYIVWSGYAADVFLKRLRRAGFEASVVPLKERGKVRARAYVGRAREGAAGVRERPHKPAARQPSQR